MKDRPPLEFVELLDAQAHLTDNRAKGPDWDVSRMPWHGNGDVSFSKVVYRVPAGTDSPVGGALQF